MSRVLSRSGRLLGAAVLACASVPLLGVGAAHADSAVKMPTNSAYFSAEGVDKPDQSPAAPPNLGADADGVSPGNLAVASKGGAEDKVSFLYFDLFDLAPGTVISKAVVTLQTVNNPPNDLSFQASPDKVVACMAGDQGFNGDDGAGLAKNAPLRLCDKFSAPAKASADGKAYAFDVTALANTWLVGDNEGLAFTTSKTATSSNFQVVFGGVKTAELSLTYAVPGVTPTAPVGQGTTPVVTPQAPSTGGFPPSDSFQPSDSGFAPAPTTDFGAPSVAEPFVPAAPNPAPQQAPVVNQPQASPAFTPVAAREASMRPGSSFWLVAILGAGALALLSLIMGDSAVPAASASRSRLTKALSSRQGTSAMSAGFRARPV